MPSQLLVGNRPRMTLENRQNIGWHQSMDLTHPDKGQKILSSISKYV
jgi:hypothetical protein